MTEYKNIRNILFSIFYVGMQQPEHIFFNVYFQETLLSLVETKSESTSNNITNNWDDSEDASYFQTVDSARQRLLDFQVLYMNLSERRRKAIGHQIKRMVLNCVYNEYRCSPR